MNPTLLRIGFLILLSALLFGGYTNDAKAQELSTVWERSDRTGAENPKPDWFTVGSVRGAAYGVVNGNERFYVADRENNTIRVMDAETGADIVPGNAFDLTGVSGGTFGMNDVEVSDDGVIFLGNLASAESPFRLYWWTEEGGTYADSVTIDVAGRVGDKFSVVGSVADNSIEVWLPVASSDPGIVHVATTDDQGVNWNIETITLSGDNVSIPASPDAYPLDLGRSSDFYVAANGKSPTRFTSTGEYVTDSQFPASSFTSSRNGFEAFKLNGEDHLAVYTYRPDGVDTGNKTGRVYVYNVSDATSPVTVAESPMIGDDVDTFSSIHGIAQVRINDDGTYNVFALEGVNGFAAFSNASSNEPVSELPSNLYFSEYIEGSGNNKALEIYNNTDSTITLTNYRIEQSSNGDGWEFYHEFAENASIEGGGTYVLITDEVDEALFAAENADEVLAHPSPIHFNGNDARALIHINPATEDTTRLDVFGDPDSDVTWDIAGVSGAASGHTLLRKASVTEGNSDPLVSFGTNEDDSEWIVNDEDDFSNLGELTPEETPAEPLAGDYYIPQGDNDQGFASLAEAFNTVNETGLSSSVNIYISEDLDETSDSLKLDRNDLSETVNLTIKPESGTSPTITVTGGEDGDGILLQETAWVTIDGSNEPGGNTRDMTITSADAAFSSVIYVYGSSNITIKNTNLSYTGDVSGTIGIAADVDATSSVENLLVENNLIGSSDGEFKDGIAVWGSQTNPTQATVINNDVYARHRGITTYWNLDNTFDGNRISIVNPIEDQSFYSGIYLVLTLGETNVVNNEVQTLAVNRTSDAGGGYAAGIVMNATLDVLNIYNNTIASPDFTNLGDATGNSVYGIVLNNAAGNSENSIYHNSFRIGSSSETGVHAAFGIEIVDATAQTWSFMNNLYTVEQNVDNAFAYYWPADQEFESDYNNFDVAESAAVAQFSDGRFDALVDWEEQGVDENSNEAEVEFVSATDLRLTGASIGDDDLAGFPIISVTTDIDGTVRSELAPYKGAFEGNVELTGDVEIGTFALLTPEDGTLLELMSGEPETEVVVTWEEPVSSESVTYSWHADTLGGDFSDPLLSIPSDEGGTETTLTLDFQTIDIALEGLGVAEGETAELIWTVTAETEESVRFANEPFELSITRNLGVSNEISEDPKQFTLSQNYPNPFNPTSTIEFTLPAAVDVRLEVYNISGQLISTLVDSRMSAGEHSVVFDANNLASGVYLYRIRAGNFMETKQMTLIK